MKNNKITASILLCTVVLSSCVNNVGDIEKTNKKESDDKNNTAYSVQSEFSKTIPDFCGKILDSTLQQKLMNDGYILSIESEVASDVPEGTIISQNPQSGTVCNERGIKLNLVISCENQNIENAENANSFENADENIKLNGETTKSNIIINSTPKWILNPIYEYDSLETFGKTGYSIYKIGENAGIVNIDGQKIGNGNYSELFYCPQHGLSSADVDSSVQLADDLTVMPDCGYKKSEIGGNIYVYDITRSKIYLTGYSEGKFRIADITETDYFKSNELYTAVLYNCDTDIMMYENTEMQSVSEIFSAESVEMKYGVINKNLEHIIGFVYDEICDGNDCFIVKQNGKYGYRGKDGQTYYPCIFEYANTAYKGAAWVKYNGKWGTVGF